MNTEKPFSTAQEVVDTARKRAIRLATAESCTGGMIATALTSIPGVSEVFDGCVVSYSNEVKIALLGVDAEQLGRHGAVSEVVARSMAAGACHALGVDVAVSSTGIAGPDGGSAEKPVGTVWIGISGLGENSATLYHFSGTREEIRRAATEAALQTLLARIRL